MSVKEFAPGVGCFRTDPKAGCAAMGYCVEARSLTHELKTPDINDSLFVSSVDTLLSRENCGHPSNTEARNKARNILQGS